MMRLHDSLGSRLAAPACRPVKGALLGALLCLLPVTAMGDDPDQPLPAGQRGELSIQLHLHGQGQRGAVDRRMEIAVPVLSQETAAIHLLQRRADSDLTAHNTVIEDLGRSLEGEMEAATMAWAEAMDALPGACGGAAEESAACRAASARVDKAHARMDALGDRYREGEQEAAGLVSAHRYQPWMATGTGLSCGTMTATVNDPGGRTARLEVALGSAGADAASNCFHQIVLDRKSGRVTLAVAELDVQLPVPGAARGITWLDRRDLPLAPDGTKTGVLVLEDLPIDGSPRNHSGGTSVDLDNGMVIDVTWQFRAH